MCFPGVMLVSKGHCILPPDGGGKLVSGLSVFDVQTETAWRKGKSVLLLGIDIFSTS